ncbi:type II glyceraldehyde-3-phosphate dehydrogenase [Candidatus Hecatella orcuttiae]|jgi:glyceraldehyde-3-phosphate dehydrogenase (NAD(P))|uniref:type II glyceraldehyde-3-phosphate dehydrogenase n=1 Tax=Candidatus Hecatella orcuttiae TaxID=1935119 RepID=UPI002867DA61|nr:type II glyceraldehyde-3-phosphate dehydrogenase [Candidatus Hecatella orcuttiae]
MVIKVGVNGFGTIGRRVADAVALQPDMKLVGVAKTKPDYKAQLALKKGYPLYASGEAGVGEFEKAGLKVEGTVEDLLKTVDIIVDATPGGVGEKNKPAYEKARVKAVFEGGEKARVAAVSFVAQCNYDKAYGADTIRVVSCNTTGLCRTLHTLDSVFGVKKARATLIRRAADPEDIKRGPIDAIVPDPTTLPSHHGPDVNTVLPTLPITTVALKVPNTYMHVHSVSADLRQPVKSEDVIEAFQRAPRVLLVGKDEGLISTAHLFDFARDLGRPRQDIYEICVWRESVMVVDGEVHYLQAVHQEADVIPENIDAIRAALKSADVEKSMKTTDSTLKMLK